MAADFKKFNLKQIMTILFQLIAWPTGRDNTLDDCSTG